MPSLGADMEVGTIVEWRVAPGDVVHRGDIVAVVDTEKSTIEVEIFEDGTIEELVVEPGREVPVGTVLARLAPAGDVERPVPVPAPTRASTTTTAEPVEAPVPVKASDRWAPSTAAFVRASPRARAEARRRGVDLAAVAGSGPFGAVRTPDLDASPVIPRSDEVVDQRLARRRATGALMARSKREIPHYYLATTIGLDRAMAWLAEANAARPVARRLLPAALLLKAVALAAGKEPRVNGFWADGFEPATAVHLGVAISLRGGGLVAPAIRDADQLPLDDLMRTLSDLVDRARRGALRSSEVAGATITVTNLGDQGVEEVFGVIHPPQVAIVGFGRIAPRPWVVDGSIEARPVVRATLAADHRASDGHEGARFLAAMERLLQTPEDL
jgi:pyruvate dehydrogenase E2 component (dihydrolipoamide acetyltransferase)